jgi:hypothetical protein
MTSASVVDRARHYAEIYAVPLRSFARRLRPGGRDAQRRAGKVRARVRGAIFVVASPRPLLL